MEIIDRFRMDTILD